MVRNFRKIVVLCASALIVLLAISCSSQPPQDTKPATETSQAPAPADSQQQAAPADSAAAPAEGTAAPSQEQAPAPAQDQQAPKQQ